MNKFAFARASRALRRAVYFSLVTAPSLMLFVLFIMLSFNESIAGRFLSEARTLVADAPEGKVNLPACQVVPLPPGENGAETVRQINPPPPVICTRATVHVDAVGWQKETDHAIRSLYLTYALLGLVIWLLFNGFPGVSIPRNVFRKMKS